MWIVVSDSESLEIIVTNDYVSGQLVARTT
jgi:hypothetical protein